MANTLPDIIYSHSKITSIVDSKNSPYHIPYYKDTEYFSNYESYISFIKGVERLVRQNDRYRKYINYLKKEVKLNHCMVLKGIDDMDADIEMHHGPIFTLFDICAIVLEYYILRKWKISTPRIADTVLEEHQKNRVQIVMVSATVHEEIHAGNVFINYKQAYGDLASFLRKYGDALSDEYKEQINRYIDKSLLQDSTDFGVLELNPELLKNKEKL